MAHVVQAGDTPEVVAQRLLGDSRLVHELRIPGWNGEGQLPPGSLVYLSTEKLGPPTRNWTQPRESR